MTRIEVSAGIFVDDPGYGGGYPLDDTEVNPSPVDLATQYFEASGAIVSPTAEGQRWRVPGTACFIPAEQARQLSHDVRRRVGRTSLAG